MKSLDIHGKPSHKTDSTGNSNHRTTTHHNSRQSGHYQSKQSHQHHYTNKNRIQSAEAMKAAAKSQTEKHGDAGSAEKHANPQNQSQFVKPEDSGQAPTSGDVKSNDISEPEVTSKHQPPRKQPYTDRPRSGGYSRSWRGKGRGHHSSSLGRKGEGSFTRLERSEIRTGDSGKATTGKDKSKTTEHGEIRTCNRRRGNAAVGRFTNSSHQNQKPYYNNSGSAMKSSGGGVPDKDSSDGQTKSSSKTILQPANPES